MKILYPDSISGYPDIRILYPDIRILYPKLVCFGYHFLENLPADTEMTAMVSVVIMFIESITGFKCSQLVTQCAALFICYLVLSR